jgi:hypothetical protein
VLYYIKRVAHCVVSRTNSGTLCFHIKWPHFVLFQVQTTPRGRHVGSLGRPGAEITGFLPRDTDRMPCFNISAYKGRYFGTAQYKGSIAYSTQSSPVADRMVFLCCFSFNPPFFDSFLYLISLSFSSTKINLVNCGYTYTLRPHLLS